MSMITSLGALGLLWVVYEGCYGFINALLSMCMMSTINSKLSLEH